MNCPICGSKNINITYYGKIRNGAPGHMTDDDISVYCCDSCRTIWHESIACGDSLYQTDAYRESMGESVTLSEFYNKHDGEILDKLNYVGTSVYRNKLCMDIGCGGAGYADYISGVAKKMLLVEPNESFAEQLRLKGYEVFPYAHEAFAKYENKVEVITSYDVIEHVDDPQKFLKDVYNLLAPDGVAYIGTPTDYPVLRFLLGAEFDSFVFSVQHPWVFSGDSLKYMAQNSGFSEYGLKYHQRFGIGNLIAWLQTRMPKGEAVFDFVTPALNACYKAEMAKAETAEYLILEVRK